MKQEEKTAILKLYQTHNYTLRKLASIFNVSHEYIRLIVNEQAREKQKEYQKTRREKQRDYMREYRKRNGIKSHIAVREATQRVFENPKNKNLDDINLYVEFIKEYCPEVQEMNFITVILNYKELKLPNFSNFQRLLRRLEK